MRLLIFNKKKLDSIICFLILLLPFMRYYKLPIIGISIETIIILILCFLSLFHFKLSNQSNKVDHSLRNSRVFLMILCIWIFLITILYELGTSININNIHSKYSINTFMMLMPIFFLFYTIMSNNFDTSNMIKIYSVFVKVVIVIYIVQFILQLGGIEISFKIPGLQYNDSWDYLKFLNFGTSNAGRPVSLFSEPAHLCEFLLPYLVILLFMPNVEKKYSKSIGLSVIVISTVSGNGIIGGLIIWIFYFFCYGRIGLLKRIGIIIVSLLALMLIYKYLINIPLFQRMFSQLFVNTSGTSYTGTKADFRIYRGFDYFSQLQFVQKTIGVGFSHMRTYAMTNGLKSIYDNPLHEFEFFSTITQILLYSGGIGGVLFFMHLKELFTTKNIAVKAMIIVCVAIWFSSQMLFSNTHLLYLILMITVFKGGKTAYRSIV